MRILTVGYLHGSGGAEKQIIWLSNQLAEHGYDVTLCVLNENKAPYTISKLVKVVDLSQAEGRGRLRIWRRFWAFRKLVNSLVPDVTINYNLQSAYFCLGVSKKKRGKVAYSERGDPYDKEYSGLLGVVRDLTVARMDGLVFQSEGARDFFPERVRSRSVIIHNAVNVPQDRYPMPEDREKRIVSVGRLHPQKNQRLLIDAFALIAQEFPDYTLDIYGDGELHDALQNQIKNLGLESRITIHPSRKDIWDCIYKASLFVLTSDYEGMPNALMEAMALGLPCISTDCRPGGARTLINCGANGMIVPIHDVMAITACMKRLITHPVESDQLARNARHLQDSHTEDMIYGQWNSFLSSLCRYR